jgi:hypothetical protein
MLLSTSMRGFHPRGCARQHELTNGAASVVGSSFLILPTWHEAEWPVSALFVKGARGKHPFGASLSCLGRQQKTRQPKDHQYLVVFLERVLVMVVVMLMPERGMIGNQKVSSQMVKSLSALAALMLLGASIIALPGFAPKVQADEVTVLAKEDRLELRAALPNCATQVWPYFAAFCLRNAGSGAKIQEARLVTARR